MLLNRLRDYAFPTPPFATRPAYSGHCGPSSGEENDEFYYFNGHSRDDNQGG